jgi:hypothetical protein
MPAPLHPRRNAIAALEAQIARAEEIRSRYVQDLKAVPGARRTQALSRISEERVGRLRRSREVLPLAGSDHTMAMAPGDDRQFFRGIDHLGGPTAGHLFLAGDQDHPTISHSFTS